MNYKKINLRYFVVLLLGVSGFALILIMNLIFLERVGEYSELNNIVDEQQEHNGLYNGLAHKLSKYKIEVYRRKEPKIVAVGSSRVMQIRDYFFEDKFYNFGGFGLSSNGAMLETLLAKQKPEIVIVALDYFSFCTSKLPLNPTAVLGRANRASNAMPRRYLLPQFLMVDGTLGLKTYIRGLTEPNLKLFNGIPRLGISAVFAEQGFGVDGSYYYFNRVNNMISQPLNLRWSETVSAISSGNSQLPIDCQVDKGSLKILKKRINQLNAIGIKTVIFSAPLPGAIIDAYAAIASYSTFFSDWKKGLREIFPEYYDFHDLRLLGATDCEFLDSIHGGEVAYMRMIREIALGSKSPLTGRVNVALLNRLIETNRGATTVAKNSLGQAYQDVLLRERDYAGACIIQNSK